MAQKKYTDEELRQRKNARQREYLKGSGYTINNDYNKRSYTQIMVREKKEIAEAYKAKCDRLGISYSKVLHEAIQAFLEKE